MTMTDCERRLIISELPRDEEVVLGTVPGQVVSVREFAKRTIDILSTYEQQLVTDEEGRLPEDVPHTVARPLALAVSNNAVGRRARRGGSRSAFLPDEGIYLKGCWPRADRPDLFFPSVDVDVKTGVSSERKVAFGVLSREGAMREILGYLAWQRFGWPIARSPICVFEYGDPAAPLGYCVAFRLDCTYRRVEMLLPKVTVSLEDLLAAATVTGLTGRNFAVGEVYPSGCSAAAYIEAKAHALASIAVKGCFRGFLNSNAGNELLQCESEDCRLALVDFDTLHVVDPRMIADERSWIDVALIEAAKSLLPILDFVRTNADDEMTAFSAVERVVHERSRVWRAYLLALFRSCERVGYSPAELENALVRVRSHALYRSCFLDLVPNSYVLARSYVSAESLYRKQAY